MCKIKKWMPYFLGILAGIAVGCMGTLFVGEAQEQKQVENKVKTSTLFLKSNLQALKIDGMDQQIQSLKNQLKEKESLESKLKYWETFLNLQACTEEDAEKANEISTRTPLDFQTALIVVKYAKQFDLEVSLLLGVMDLESNFKQFEVGKAQDRGYMQIIPSTEKWLIKEFGEVLGFEYNPKRIFEPDYNIGLGAAYLHMLKESYGSNDDRILSEYNRGPYNLRRYYQKHATYETTYSRVVKSRAKKYLAYNN